LSGSPPVLRRVFSSVNLLTSGLLLLGAYGAVLDWRPSAYLLVATLTVSVVANLTVGVLAYRATMNRPWPQVRPLPDDDDW
jgi:hypothetical protein